MRDLYYFLGAHSDTPPYGEAAVQFFTDTAESMKGLHAKWKNHPLAVKVSIAVYEYLEIKSKAKGTQT